MEPRRADGHLAENIHARSRPSSRRYRAVHPCGAGNAPGAVSGVVLTGQPAVTLASPYAVGRWRAYRHPPTRPCVTGQWIVGATRVLAGGAPVATMAGQSGCVPTGTPMLPVSGADPRARHLSRRANILSGDLDFPYRFDGLGRTATTDRDDHIRDLIEQVLFTAPGERVMRPDFGSGLLALVFEPNSSTLAATTQIMVQGALQQYLSHLIACRRVEVA